MRVHRFFIKESVSGSDIRLTDQDVIHQMRDVFRLKKGDTVRLLDNSGFEYESVIQLLTRDEGLFHVVSKSDKGFTPKTRLHLYSALTKRTFEVVLEKGTELGVMDFTPIISERTEKQNINRERSEKIIQEAAEQSGKVVLPRLHDPLALDEIIKIIEAGESQHFIVFDMGGTSFAKSAFEGKGNISVLIGPEGGWSDHERDLFVKAGIPIYSLGPQILRAETASIAVAALLLL